MNDVTDLNSLFERRLSYPDADARDRLARLVGLDAQKDRVAKMLGILINPQGIVDWARKHHPGATNLVRIVQRRPPLVVFAGDVGSGKTELAETIGDAVARQENIGITLFPLSLSTRGQGRVGEMTQLLGAAFDVAETEARKLSARGRATGGIILLVDEADALAQSRESAQMHHEDRAGVNAFIRGIDRLATKQLPAAVIMCTNRLDALDPAVRRRAADILPFERPNSEQRRTVVESTLGPAGVSARGIEAIVKATGPRTQGSYGFAYSDLVQRYLPAVVLAAYPRGPVSEDQAIAIAESMMATPPFKEQRA
ncbi:MAG TPA: ATP-binding protein [Gemmatimonadaceae bacterium]|nr:ATP-binding protein [Gemmatimonadaceae bacterium]